MCLSISQTLCLIYGGRVRERLLISLSHDNFSAALRALRDSGVDVSVLTILLHELPPLGFTFEDWKQVAEKAKIDVFRDHTEATAVIKGGNEQLALAIVNYGDRVAFSWKRGQPAPVESMLGTTLEFVLDNKGHLLGSATYSDSRGRIEIISGKITEGSFAFGPYVGMNANVRKILHGISDLQSEFDIMRALPKSTVPDA